MNFVSLEGRYILLLWGYNSIYIIISVESKIIIVESIAFMGMIFCVYSTGNISRNAYFSHHSNIKYVITYTRLSKQCAPLGFVLEKLLHFY